MVRAPNVTVDDSMTVDLGGREVQIRHLGRGNTSGDVVVFLPRERIVAAGDLLVYPFPYLIGGYPEAWAQTLTRLEQLDGDGSADTSHHRRGVSRGMGQLSGATSRPCGRAAE